MNGHDHIPRLRIGIIDSGFIANFHLQALVNVREGNEVMVEATHS